ncbi:hypothetical protein CA234_10595 [Sphingomonas sp. ABOLE]|uniref:hypothetical protein n=1 Tax=Sphingomonas sp. ABOLE TaxID=1985878 RepID=UPI000F7F8716|nr:hypothetical protein [Sphingomonas sp. ABOLE]RSV40857.1 hypothetical protein CA234_10595 [Sphingomonas sp. ABOLE]
MVAHLREQLQQIFGAYVHQDTLDTAAAEMAGLGQAYPDLDEGFRGALRRSIEFARSGDAGVCIAIEKSGYRALNTAEAQLILAELLRLYIVHFNMNTRD